MAMCMSLCSLISKTTCPLYNLDAIFFTCYLPWLDHNATHYVLHVLWTMSHLTIIRKAKVVLTGCVYSMGRTGGEAMMSTIASFSLYVLLTLIPVILDCLPHNGSAAACSTRPTVHASLYHASSTGITQQFLVFFCPW